MNAAAISPTRTALAAAALALPLALGGCKTTPVPPAQQLLNACEDYEGVLATIVTHGELGNLTLEQLEYVAKVDATVAPLCMGDLTTPDGTPLTTSEALRKVEDAYVEFLKLQQQGES